MKKRFKFSVIMSVYNVEQYLEEAFISIARQTIGFEENIQVILVNDGSSDDSATICKAIASCYPENVVYYEQDNSGLPAARNAGLKLAEGDIINFFDPDDTLPENVFEEVYAFLNENAQFIDMATIPLVYFGAQTGLHGKYKTLGARNRIVNLEKEPHNFVLSSAGSFYKSEVFRTLSFDPRMVTAEDTKLNLALYQRNPQFGYVCENRVRYNYRRRTDGKSNVDLIRNAGNTEAWTSLVYLFEDLLDVPRELTQFEKEIMAYELRSRLRDLRKDMFADEAQYESLLNDYSKWIQRLDDDFIMRRSKFIDNKEKKDLFLRLKGSSLAEAMKQGRFDRGEFKVELCSFRNRSGIIEVECLINNFGYKDFDLIVLDCSAPEGDASIIIPQESIDIESGYDKTIGEFTLDITHYRKLILPIKVTKYVLAFYDRQSNSVFPAHSIHPTAITPFALNASNIGPIVDGHKITLNRNSILIRKAPKPLLIEKIKDVKRIYNRDKKIPIFRLASMKKKHFVLINDRPTKAGDNGQALFDHIMEHGSKRLRRCTFYVLDKESEDWRHLSSHRHVVPYGSWLHRILFVNARLLYSSHNARLCYLPNTIKGARRYADLLDYQFIWLQHGITKDDISQIANRLHTGDDYVCVSTNPERQEFLRQPYFLGNDRVITTGFARYDKLNDSSEKIVAICPTWRTWLTGSVNKTGMHNPIGGFDNSDYYSNYYALITNNELLSKARELGYRIVFLLHAGMDCYAECFADAQSNVVQLIRQKEANYQELFSKAAVLVTDYSSIAFDFAYLKKPIIYFQFDEEAFFQAHYNKGYFDYRENGFGPVVSSLSDLIEEILKCLDNGATMAKPYTDRVNATFEYHDRNNCERILTSTLPNDLK